MAKIVFWLLMLVAFVYLFRAWPYIAKLRKQSPLLYVFPTKRNRSLPEFGPMWRNLAVFYLLLAVACVWGVVLLMPGD